MCNDIEKKLSNERKRDSNKVKGRDRGITHLEYIKAFFFLSERSVDV